MAASQGLLTAINYVVSAKVFFSLKGGCKFESALKGHERSVNLLESVAKLNTFFNNIKFKLIIIFHKKNCTFLSKSRVFSSLEKGTSLAGGK